jgi:hypothetical protein
MERQEKRAGMMGDPNGGKKRKSRRPLPGFGVKKFVPAVHREADAPHV